MNVRPHHPAFPMSAIRAAFDDHSYPDAGLTIAWVGSGPGRLSSGSVGGAGGGGEGGKSGEGGGGGVPGGEGLAGREGTEGARRGGRALAEGTAAPTSWPGGGGGRGLFTSAEGAA